MRVEGGRRVFAMLVVGLAGVLGLAGAAGAEDVPPPATDTGGIPPSTNPPPDVSSSPGGEAATAVEPTHHQLNGGVLPTPDGEGRQPTVPAGDDHGEENAGSPPPPGGPIGADPSESATEGVRPSPDPQGVGPPSAASGDDSSGPAPIATASADPDPATADVPPPVVPRADREVLVTASSGQRRLGWALALLAGVLVLIGQPHVLPRMSPRR